MIPDDWVRCKLGNLAKIKTGGTPKRMEPHYWGGDIPWMSSGEIHKRYISDTKEFITEDGLKSSNACLLPQETVMIALNGQGRTRGTVAILRTSVTCNQSLAGFIAHSDILNADYLFFYLDSKYQYLRDLSGDYGRNGLNLKLLQEIEIDLPPLPEQKKIAAILSSVDDAIQATQDVIDQTHTVKQGLLQQLLTRGIGHTRFKQTEIGVIPDGWQVQNLADVAHIILGQSPPSSACNETVKGYPFYQGNADFGYLYPLPQCWIENPLKVAKKDDILISVRAPVGELNIANTDCCIGRGVGAIRPLSANRDFVYYTLLNARNSLASVSQGSTFDAINGKELRNLPLLIPPLPEQEQIAAILSSMDEYIQKEQAKFQQNIKIKRGLMQDLLTGRVRVNFAE